jgi:ferrous iron transport protein A
MGKRIGPIRDWGHQRISTGSGYIMPLTMAPRKARLRIISLVGGRGLQSHLIDMGLNVGSEIEIIQPGAPGPFLVAVGETRLAIGHGMAQKITVSIVG